jgi:hypothetical protein
MDSRARSRSDVREIKARRGWQPARVRKFSVGENVAGRENLESAMTLILISSRSGVLGSRRDTSVVYRS